MRHLSLRSSLLIVTLLIPGLFPFSPMDDPALAVEIAVNEKYQAQLSPSAGRQYD